MEALSLRRTPTSKELRDSRRSGGRTSLRAGLSKRAPEPNDISVGVDDPSFPLSIVLVLRAMHIDACPTPFVCHLVSLLTVNVESALTRDFISYRLRKVDREIPVPMGEGIRAIVG